MDNWKSELFNLFKSNNIVGFIKWILVLFCFFSPAIPIILIFYYKLFIQLEFFKLMILILFIDSIIILYFGLIAFLSNSYEIVTYIRDFKIPKEIFANLIEEAESESGETQPETRTFNIFMEKCDQYRKNAVNTKLNGGMVNNLIMFITLYYVMLLVIFGFTYFLRVPLRIEDIINSSLVISNVSIWVEIRKWGKNKTSTQKKEKFIPISLKVYFSIQFVFIILLILKIRL